MKVKARDTFSAIRIRKGYSIAGLAKEMGVNPSVAFNVEKGNNIRPATAKKACEALSEPFEALFIIKEDEENE